MGSASLPGGMKQGASDIFQTPPQALEPLMPFLRPEWTIWEPAAGKGNLVRGLAARGLRVVASDISTDREYLGRDVFPGMDFLNTTPAFHYDAIVTNPPFSFKDEFLGWCYARRKPFALLLPVTALAAKGRQSLYREHGVEVILMDGRLDFETPSGEGSGAWFECGWFCGFMNIGRQLTFWTPPSPQASLALEVA